MKFSRQGKTLHELRELCSKAAARHGFAAFRGPRKAFLHSTRAPRFPHVLGDVQAMLKNGEPLIRGRASHLKLAWLRGFCSVALAANPSGVRQRAGPFYSASTHPFQHSPALDAYCSGRLLLWCSLSERLGAAAPSRPHYHSHFSGDA